MVRNYLTIALRSFGRQKIYAIINIFGLSVGIASAILIFLYIHSEVTFDSNFPDSENTYILGLTFTDPEGQRNPNTYIPGGWTSTLQQRLNDVDGGMRLWWMGMPASFHYVPDDRIILNEDIYWVQNTFHEFMYFPVIKGNKERALELVNSMAISESAALELFGDIDPIGEQITLKHSFATNNQPLELTVTAVFEDYPENTHLRPKYLVNYYALKPFQNFPPGMTFESMEEHMFDGGFMSYVHANNGTTAEDVEAEMNDMIDEILRDNPNLQEQLAGATIEPVARNVEDIHFDTDFPWVNEGGGNITYVYTFGSIALLILFVAAINYMNLATARSVRRSREVGLRKALGSERRQIFIQFMLESFIMVFFAFFVALILVAIFLPRFNTLAGTAIGFGEIFSPLLLLWLGLMLFLTAFLSGIYPALFLSGFNTIDVLKGKFSFSRGSNLFRRGLIGFQYVVALILLIATFIAVNQMNMMQNSKLNEAGDQILSIRYGGTADYNKYATFKNMLRQDPELQEVTFGNHLPRLDYFGPLSVPYRFPDVTEEENEWNTLNVDFDFLGTYGLELVAGRMFEVGNTADSTNIILNETAVKALGKTAEEMVGSSMSYPRVDGYFNYNYDTLQTGQVIGVVKDFPYQSAYQPIDPLVISPTPHFLDLIVYIKLPQGRFQEKIAFIEETWRQIYPNIGLDYWFVNDEFNRMYVAEQRVAALSVDFAVLAILITCVGLFGLASFVTEQKTKEIGIRKTLGATNFQILSRILMLFLKVMLISALIAIPVGFFLTDWWLANFAQQTPLHWTVFAGSAFIIALLTIVTVGYESLKASLANPVRALRYE